MFDIHPEHSGMAPEGLMLLARTSEDRLAVMAMSGTAQEQMEEAPPATELQQRWKDAHTYTLGRYGMLYELDHIDNLDWSLAMGVFSTPSSRNQ